ncbi:MAG: hypothetical protein ACXWK8_00025 [Myxococcaceae bacterium]
MRTLLAALALLSADAGPPASSGRPATYAEARRAFARAYQAGALDEARSALGRARAAVPGRLDLDYDLGCLEARAGHLDRAFEVLQAVSAAGLPNDWAADHDLDALHADPRWTPLLARVEAARAPVAIGGRQTSVPPELGLVEDLAQDPASGAVFVSSVRTGEVWRERDGRWSAWAHAAPVGSAAFALGLDPRRSTLHVAVAAVPQAEGYRKADQGQSSLVTFALGDAAEGRRLVPPGDGPHLLGDMGLGPDGTVFVSDARAGTVYRLRPGASALEALVPDQTFASPQTPVLTLDGGTLLVPDWTLGLFALPLSGGKPRPLRAPGDLVTAGIDGLAPAPGGLLAVQNGIVQQRVIRLWLSPDGRAITRWVVLGRGPDLGDPTHVVATPRGALVLIDSGWGRFTDDGVLRPGAPPARPRLVRLDLH